MGVLYGERDKTELKEESIYWMQNIPDHTNVMIPRAEHAAFVGNPEEFHKEILRFLSTQCTLGEDTDTMDSDLTDMYDDDALFGYQRGDTDTDSDYYDDADSDYGGNANQNFEEYLAQYFEEEEDGYGDSEYDDVAKLYGGEDETDEDDMIDLEG